MLDSECWLNITTDQLAASWRSRPPKGGRTILGVKRCLATAGKIENCYGLSWSKSSTNGRLSSSE